MKKLSFLFALLCASMMGWATQICDFATGHENNADYGNTDARVLITLEPTSNTNEYTLTVKPNTANGNTAKFDYIYVIASGNSPYPAEAGTDEGGTSYDELSVTFTNSNATASFTIQWSTPGWGGRWQCTMSDVDLSGLEACGSGSCADTENPTISAVASSDITYNSVVLSVTASDNVGVTRYIVKNGASQIASSTTSPITVTGLSAGTTYDNIKVIAKDACDNESSEFAVTSFTTLARASECSGDLGHWGNPSVKRISYMIEYLPIIDKIKYTVQGYGTEVLNYLQIRVASPTITNSGDLAIIDGVATWLQNAPAAGTEMAVQFYYGLVSMGEGREITQDGEVSLSNPQSVYYKSHDCAAVGGPSTVPAAPDDKNDCQVFSIFGTEGFGSHATHAEWWDGAMSYLTGSVNGKPVYFTTRGTTANIQYPSLNINAYDKLHFDIWTDAAREIGVELCINAGEHGTRQNITTTAAAWKSVDLDLAGFHDPQNVNTTFLLLSSLARETYYVANVYIYKTAADESCYADCGVNVALGKLSEAGCITGEGNNAAKANDGNNSEWQTGGNVAYDNQWWYVDLGKAYNLDKITITFENARSNHFLLQGRLEAPSVAQKSEDAAWTTLKEVTEEPLGDYALNEYDVSGKVARFVRFKSLSNTYSNAYGCKIREFSVCVTGVADVDLEKPVMTSASLDSKNHNKVIINVAATDNKGIASYHVVETTHSIDSEFAPEAGKITITGLTAETSYSFVITAKDFFDNESDNSKSVSVTTNAYLTAPSAAATAPTWPSAQVKAMYSPTYSADCGLGEWGSGTAVADDTYGKKYTVGPNGDAGGYFGMTGFNLNCLNMEKLHFDIWVADDMTIRFVPIWGGAEQGVTKNLSGQVWNSIDIDLTEYTGITDWSNIYQIKLDQMLHNFNLWIGNAYFYRTSAIVDSEAPTNVSASLEATGFYSVKITASAEDNSGAVNFSIKNGDTEVATGAAATGVATTITVNGLTPGTAYNFNVIALDETGNAAAPVAVVATTKAVPASAPTPVTNGKNIVPVYSDVLTGALTGIQSGGWGESTQVEWLQITPNDQVFYAQNFNYAGWHSWGAAINATNMMFLHVDIYSTGMTSMRITPISPGHELPTAQVLTPNAWTSIDIPLSVYASANIDWSDIFQFKFDEPVGGNELMIDNVYFWQPVANTTPDVAGQDNTGGWATFSCTEKVAVPSGVTAYKAVYSKNGTDEILNLESIGGVIPAGEGVILKGAAGTPYEFLATNEAAPTITDNELVGCPVRTDISTVLASNDVFCLRYSEAYAMTGFFLYTGQYVPAGKAYLALPKQQQGAGAPERRLRFVINETTSIVGAEAENAKSTKFVENGQLFIRRGDTVYTIQGIRVK